MSRGYSVTPERRRRVAIARQLRDTGLSVTEVAERMGIKRRSASDLLSDPWREKANRRRALYGGKCGRCGQQTDGSAGRSKPAPEFCSACAPAKHATWNKTTILAAIARYARETGHQPVSREWLLDRPSYAPPVSTVLNNFGSWSAAMHEAGFASYVGIKHKLSDTKGAKMFRVLAQVEPGVWKEIGEFVGNRAQAVTDALDSLNGDAKPERVMTLHPSAMHVHRARPVEKIVYVLEDE